MISFLLVLSASALSFALSVVFTPIIRRLALVWAVTDRPGLDRKVHTKPVPLLGGWAITISLLLSTSIIWACGFWPAKGGVEYIQLFGMACALVLVMIVGSLDDIQPQRPLVQLSSLLIVLVPVVATNIGIFSFRVFGGNLVTLSQQEQFFTFTQMQWHVAWLPIILTAAWLVVIMLTTKLLDGLDGLVAGVGAIAGIVLFAVSLLPQLNQPQTAILAILFCGACLGFLVYNWHPASIFLGQGGSLLIGLVLGLLSIISGTKVITLLLVMGLPVLDVLWVTARRIFIEHHSPLIADRHHFHHRLLDAGLTHQQAVTVIWLITLTFGVSGVILQTQQKIVALLSLIVFVLVLGVFLMYRTRHTTTKR